MKLRNRAVLSLLLPSLSLLCTSISFAQNQNNFWVYGYQAGIDFNTTPPSYQGEFSIQASEGAASVSDPSTGELLFYTDGATVWDASNSPMPNGTGLLGSSSGELSSTTAAVICEKPGSANQYYLFTIDEQYSSGGVRYNIIDMTLNGGLGDIVAGQKNIPVFSTNSEKMCLVPNAGGTGYWLITHSIDTYYAFAVTSAGVSTTPIVSFVGPAHANGAGFMKVSPQLDRIAVANIFYQNAEVFDFDRSTGVISNPVVIDYTFFGAAGGPYGIEFSCSGRFLYVSDGSNLTQFDLNAGNESQIIASAYSVLTNSFSCYGLQLGPDLKIYVSNGALDVIENPDESGAACNYIQGAISGQMSGGGWGLPQWVYRVGDNAVACTSCQPVTINTTVNSCGPYTTPTGDVYTTSGSYTLNLSTSAGCDSIVALNLSITAPPVVAITQTQAGCGNETTFNLTAAGSGPFTFAVPSESISTTSGLITLPAGNYEALVTDINGCSTTVSLDNSTANNCPEDFDENFVVGVSDLLLFNAAYGCTVDCCPYDLTGDGAVSVADLLYFIAVFGTFCE
jgi:hypothetical protein